MRKEFLYRLKNKFIFLSLFIALSFQVTRVFGVDSITPSSNWYFNLNTGYTTQQYLPNAGIAATLNAGYAFNRGFSLETGYSGIFSQQYNTNQYHTIFNTAIKGTIPLGQEVAIYGRLGGGIDIMNWRGSANLSAPNWYCNNMDTVNFIGMAGIGVSFRLSRHFDLHAEDTLYLPLGGGNQTSGAMNMILGGMQYNF